MSAYNLFLNCPLGVADLLLAEVQRHGAGDARTLGAGVQCAASLETAYRLCLWSRLASRVLLRLSRFEARDTESLYAGVRALAWPEVFACEATFAVRATLQAAPLTHSGYVAQRVKDAVADSFRAASGRRPSVDKHAPDVRLHLHWRGARATLSLDLAGHSLHRRGYRGEAQVAAPLKENLAAAILQRLGWPTRHADGALLDPMCGAATLLLEGGAMAANRAPGLARERFGFHAWHAHAPELWARLCEEARQAAIAPPSLFGYDVDSRALRLAAEAAERAGLVVTLDKRALADLQPPPAVTHGLVVTNPPYGERLPGDDLPALYHQLGLLLRRFAGWHAGVFTGKPELMFRTRREARARHALFNGPLPCVLFDFGRLAGGGSGASAALPPAAAAQPLVSTGAAATAPTAPALHGAGTGALGNRLRKNLRRLRRWRQRDGIDCFRVYDADIPEYAFALDYYAGEQVHLHLQEYAAPASVDAERARARSDEQLAVVAEVFADEAPCVHRKLRQRQPGAAQYTPLAAARRFDIVREAGLRFYVNFDDYLDTGLFLDHRLTRARLRAATSGRDFLNLFAYTGSATVYAAAGGAASTTSVDLSNTYLQWAGDNLRLNGLDAPAHRLVRADCLAWMEAAARDRQRWDLVFLDPPSFSNSSAMRGTLDIQRDHPALIHGAVRLLRRGGTLLFSSNRRRLRLQPSIEAAFTVRDVTRATTPPDFARRPAHRCWEITLPSPRAGH